MRVHLVAVARGLIKVHETGRWAHINVKLLHFKEYMYEIAKDFLDCHIINALFRLSEILRGFTEEEY